MSKWNIDEQVNSIAANYVMPAHQHNGIDKRAMLVKDIKQVVDNTLQNLHSVTCITWDEPGLCSCGLGKFLKGLKA